MAEPRVRDRSGERRRRSQRLARERMAREWVRRNYCVPEPEPSSGTLSDLRLLLSLVAQVFTETGVS